MLFACDICMVKLHLQPLLNSESSYNLRRGARVVMEQIANLSTGNRCRGSNPRLSAIFICVIH